MCYDIRPVDVLDAKELNRLKTMVGVFETTINDPAETVVGTEDWIKQKGRFDYYFACELKAEPKLIGYVILEINANPRLMHVANLRIAVDSDYHNKKIGTDLLTFALEYADNWLPIKKIELSVVANNHHVVNWYKNNGFIEEGIKQKGLLVDGSYVDMRLMARFKNE